MKLTILGCYSATPRTLTNPTAQVLALRNHLFLIDCGEGTQVQLRKQKIKFSRIKHVFISHLHGDHFFGLPGLISTFRMLGRKAELHIYGPEGLEEAMRLLLKLGNSWIDYPLIFHVLKGKHSEVLFEDDNVTVSTIPLNHRIYANGFLFKAKPANRKLNIAEVLKYDIEKCYYQNIKKGKDITLPDGTLIPNAQLTSDPPPPQSYAFCSDTRYYPDIIPLIKNVDVLYHESTFLERHGHLAEKTGHSTARQAAAIARQAGVKTLILGHYSTRYKALEEFTTEAGEIFPDTYLAEDGKIFEF